MGLLREWISTGTFCFTKWHPKPIENRRDIPSEPSPNLSKISPKPFPGTSEKNEPSPKRHFFDFSQFSTISGWSQRPFRLQNPKKIETKSSSKMFCFFTSIFRRFFIDLATQTTPKPAFFESFFENVDFAKILAKHRLCTQKSRFKL